MKYAAPTHVGLGRNVVVLQILLPVEGDVGDLDLALLTDSAWVTFQV